MADTATPNEASGAQGGVGAGGADGAAGAKGQFSGRGRRRGGQKRRSESNIHEGRKRAAGGKAPQKRFFRQRAHCNPLAFNESFD